MNACRSIHHFCWCQRSGMFFFRFFFHSCHTFTEIKYNNNNIDNFLFGMKGSWNKHCVSIIRSHVSFDFISSTKCSSISINWLKFQKNKNPIWLINAFELEYIRYYDLFMLHNLLLLENEFIKQNKKWKPVVIHNFSLNDMNIIFFPIEKCKFVNLCFGVESIITFLTACNDDRAWYTFRWWLMKCSKQSTISKYQPNT